MVGIVQPFCYPVFINVSQAVTISLRYGTGSKYVIEEG